MSQLKRRANKMASYVDSARSVISTALRYCAMVFVCLSGIACTTYEYHETKNVAIEKLTEDQEAALAEEEILDVGIVLLDAGIDELHEDDLVYSSVRESEAVWFSSLLKATLDKTNAWGLVRTVPSQDSIMDVLVSGKILESNGEVVRLKVKAQDISGRVWIDKEYQQQASQYAYNPEVNWPGDPFQATFNEISNDLFNYRSSLGRAESVRLRNLSKVLFAREFVPNAFDDYVVKDEAGQFSLSRVPAASDPMMRRTEQIRARNDLFLDVLQDYYRAFNNSMDEPYTEWRKLSYKQVVYARQLKDQARKEKIAGVVAIVGGIAASRSDKNRETRGAGHIAIMGGAQIFANSFLKLDEALAHSETLRELGASLEGQLEPSVIDLQDRSVTLSGTVDDQFKEWRRILSRMYQLEEGEEDPLEPASDTTVLIEEVETPLDKISDDR